jgi:hypothetical protein
MLHRLVKWAAIYPDAQTVTPHIRKGIEGRAPIRISIFCAFNGKLLEIQTPETLHVHSDWVSEYMLVPEGEDLYSAVSTILMANGITK